jgi:hypothetical protein
VEIISRGAQTEAPRPEQELIPMKKSGTEGNRLNTLTEMCLALPEAKRETMGDHAAFTVRDKKFVNYLHDHHGDGIISVCFRTEPGQNDVLLASDATRFYSPAYIGPRGWVGLRLDVGKIDWAEVNDFVTESYRMTAPKRLAAQVSPRPS